MTEATHPVLLALSDSIESLDLQGGLAVGYSGGLDSTVLLHGLHQLGVQVQAFHVNHQLQPQAIAWQRHCQNTAQQWSVPFVAMTVDVPQQSASLEAQARDARYRAMFTKMREQGLRVLACAHHLDDQIETVLLQLFRGSGLRGLAGMQAFGPVGVDRAEYAELRIFRPLLSLPKADLIDYAQLNKLDWIEDPSNHDTDIRRNWLRQELLPQLREKFAQSDAAILRVADFFRMHFDKLDESLLPVLENVVNREVLQLERFRKLNTEIQSEVLRAWLAGFGIRCNRIQLEELLRQLQLPQGGKRQVVSGWFIQVSQHKAKVVKQESEY